MTYQDIFKRYELKFLITDEQLKRMQEVMREHVESDRFGRSAICNLYYDTPDFLLIRRSLDKPFYKEKTARPKLRRGEFRKHRLCGTEEEI